VQKPFAKIMSHNFNDVIEDKNRPHFMIIAAERNTKIDLFQKAKKDGCGKCKASRYNVYAAPAFSTVVRLSETCLSVALKPCLH